MQRCAGENNISQSALSVLFSRSVPTSLSALNDASKSSNDK